MQARFAVSATATTTVTTATRNATTTPKVYGRLDGVLDKLSELYQEYLTIHGRTRNVTFTKR